MVSPASALPLVSPDPFVVAMLFAVGAVFTIVTDRGVFVATVVFPALSLATARRPYWPSATDDVCNPHWYGAAVAEQAVLQLLLPLARYW
jgi:hypothetical protein